MDSSPLPKKVPMRPATNFVQRVAYGMGSFVTLVGKNAPKALTNQIYNIELGVSPALVGLAITVSRLIDAFTDPLMGSISDRCRSRWGRRRPFIFVGALLTGLVFAGMWLFPRDATPGFYASYLFTFVILHYLALTVYSVPWYALGYEMTPDTRERNSVMAYAGFLGAGATMLIGWIYAMAHWSIFASPLEGIRWIGSGVGLLLFLLGVLPALFIKERAFVEVTKKQAPVPMLAGIKQCFANAPFRRLMGMLTLMLIGSSMVGSLGFYVITYYMYKGDTAAASVLAGIIATVSQVGAFVLIPLATGLANRFGKKELMLGVLALAFIGSLLKWVCFNQEFPYLAVIPGILLAPVFAVGSNMLSHSMIGDICDVDELEHGSRREGLYGAVFSWIFKTGLALSFFLGGAILVGIGFKVELKGEQPELTLTLMRAAFSIVPALFIAISFVIFRGYHLNEERMHAVRAELEARRGVV